MRSIILSVAASTALLIATGAAASGDLGYPARELLVTGADVLGQPIGYPAGTPKITSAIVTIEPGGEGQLHSHQVPMYAYVLQGAVTVNYGSHGSKVYRQGEALMEAQRVPHKGTNTGTEPVALLVVYIGAEGTPNATPVSDFSAK